MTTPPADPAPVDGTTPPAAPPAGGQQPPAAPPAGQPPVEADPPGAEHLGDPGKKALDEMKAKWKAAEATAREREQELAALRAQAEGKEAEHKAALEAQRVRDEALAAANERILKAEVRAAATGKLADPADALQFLDLSTLEVSPDGEVDSAAVAAAIETLIKSKPYLAAQGGNRFQGTADGGTRKETRPAQLTRADLARMSPAEIETARVEGRLADLLSGKQ
jgi:hypothetical protein